MPPIDVMIIETPTPQRAPVLERLKRIASQPLRVYFLYDHDSGRGWGNLDAGSATVVRSARDVWRLLRDLTSADLGVVCLFGYRGWLRVLAAVITRLRRAPLVLRSDSNTKDEEERPRWRRLAKRVYLRLLLGDPEIWTIGTNNARYWSALGFHRQVRIPYVVPVPPARSDREAALLGPVLHDDFVVGYVGRLHPTKGIDDLIRAWASFRAEVPESEVALLICGSGEVDGRVGEYAATETTCHSLGALSHAELGSVYARCDIVVVPSRGPEAWGLVVNEALAYGARVIASDRVGAADDLVEEANGQRFPAGDVPALVRCLHAEHARGRGRVTPPPLPDVAAMMHERLRAHR